MATLAIKGHLTKGREVIQLLEMLGGNNNYSRYSGDNTNANIIYHIDHNDRNFIKMIKNPNNNSDFIVFTLEEFEEKFPYKVGNKVLYKPDNKTYFIIKMFWENDKILYDLSDEVCLKGCTMFYPLISDVDVIKIQHYKEENYCQVIGNDTSSNGVNTSVSSINKETMEERKYSDLKLPLDDDDDKLATEATIDGNKITPPENYLIGKITKVDNGMLVEFVKKQLQYPKDYKECCEVIGYRLCGTTIIGYKSNVLKTLQELLVCRNAYWKIAGEEMKLGKPWEPDYNDNIKYIISVRRNDLDFDATIERNYVLIFPTEKIRNMFYMNFKELINRCKQLL